MHNLNYKLSKLSFLVYIFYFWQGRFIIIVLCVWDVRHPVVLLSCLALLSNGLLYLINILDDYLMAAPTYLQCRIDLARFSSLCDYLGVSMCQKKTVRPSNILSWIRLLLVGSSGSITGLKRTVLDFKHFYNRPNVSITLKRRSDFCPVQSLFDKGQDLTTTNIYSTYWLEYFVLLTQGKG